MYPEYYLSTSKTEVTGGTWSATQPEKTKDAWIWVRYKTVFTDESTGYSDGVLDEVLNDLVDISISNKSNIAQLNDSITHLVVQTSETKNELKTVQTGLSTLGKQTADGFNRTVQKSEYDKTINEIEEQLDNKGLHIGSDKEDTVTTIDASGVSVVASDGKLLARFDKVDSMLAYLKVLEYLCAGAHRIEAKNIEAEITSFVGGVIKTAKIDASIINWIGDVN